MRRCGPGRRDSLIDGLGSSVRSGIFVDMLKSLPLKLFSLVSASEAQFHLNSPSNDIVH